MLNAENQILTFEVIYNNMEFVIKRIGGCYMNTEMAIDARNKAGNYFKEGKNCVSCLRNETYKSLWYN